MGDEDVGVTVWVAVSGFHTGSRFMNVCYALLPYLTMSWN